MRALGRRTSPYLRTEGRLADVIAAIQAMGTYKFYKLDFAGWADRISGDEAHAGDWQAVFEGHPEFFRLDSAREKASLVWRRQHPKRFSVDDLRTITKEEFDSLSGDEKSRISRTPLGSEEIAALVRTATDLHSRALEQRRDARWWISGLFGLIGVTLGALLSSC